MKSSCRMTTLSMTLAAALALVPGAFASDGVRNANELSQMAKNATTPADHARVARGYLTHAKSLDEKAGKLEREVEASKAGPKSAMETKWPAMVTASRDRKEQLAMQARRAAQESQRLAEHHSKLSGQSIDQIAALD